MTECGTVGMALSRSGRTPLRRDCELPGTSSPSTRLELGDRVGEEGEEGEGGEGGEEGEGPLRRLARAVRSWMTELAWHSPR